jgi:glycosyltransferase involved in cell wall biosynthesis
MVCGPGVELAPIPSYVGPFEYLRRRGDVLRAIDRCAELDGSFLFRIPSQIGFLLSERLEAQGRVYGAEVLTDPDAFFSHGVAPHGLAFLFHPYFAKRTREMCAKAVAVNYITGSRTQRLYPPAPGVWSKRISDVDLGEDAFLDIESRFAQADFDQPVRVVSVGYLDLLAKAPDVLIRAIAAVRQQGVRCELTFVGDGRLRTELMQLAAKLGIGDAVRVTGALGGAAAVRRELAKADLFALPSRAEGMPRALIEAMAAGVPAICSRVGAMEDFIEARWLIKPASLSELTAKILDFSQSRGEWKSIAIRNQEKVRPLLNSNLEPVRMDFYRTILKGAAVESQGAKFTEGWNHAA